MARKWGSCQKNRMLNSAHAPGVTAPSTAAKPIIGGMAPGTAPTTVHRLVRVFSGVYANTYVTSVSAASAAASAFTSPTRYSTPAADSVTPNANASIGETRPAGRGRLAVRGIL